VSDKELFEGPERRGAERRQRAHSDDDSIDIVVSDSPELRKLIGRRMGAIRRLQKHSQAVVAEHIGVSRPHLSNIELGRSRTSWAGLRAMAEYYKLGLRELIDDCSAHLSGQEGAVRSPTMTATGGGRNMGVGHDGQKGIRVPELLSDDERFVLGLLRVLGPVQQHQIATQILELVQQRSQQVGVDDK
jgi:DNA-binding XRE family transcriptional regulator